MRHRWREALLVAPLLLGYGAVLAQEAPQPVSYNLQVKIEPKRGTIHVRGKIKVPTVAANAGNLKFALHETFAIKKLLVNGRPAKFSFQTAEFSPLNPATRNVTVAVDPSTATGMMQLEMEYGGKLREIPEFNTYPDQKLALDDQINGRMVELANYSSWYPQFFTFGRPIEIAMEVSLPKGWIAICSGRKVKESQKGGRGITHWSSPKDADILITAAPQYKRKVVSAPDGQVEIYYTQLPENFIEKEGEQLATVMSLFSQGLGDPAIPSTTVKHVFSPKRNGQGRAGIARPGMIVTSEGRVLEELKNDPNYSLLQDLAHEIAHFWWNFGAGQGDWINEAFAEYSSAVAVKQIVSNEEFDKIMERYRGEVRELPMDAPSLAKVPFDGSGFVVRYYKGSLMLEAMRQALGESQFYEDAREFFNAFRGKSIGTDEFRAFWKDKMGEQKDVVDLWLDSGGGLPDVVKTETSKN